MYYVSPKAGEHFYLRLLLTAVKGSTDFKDLCTFAGVELPTFRQACLAYGLLAVDNEWDQCLTEAGLMATGYQLRILFLTILQECGPASPGFLWEKHKVDICNDLQHTLQHRHNYPNVTQEDALDYGLYLIDRVLLSANKSLGSYCWESTYCRA